MNRYTGNHDTTEIMLNTKQLIRDHIALLIFLSEQNRTEHNLFDKNYIVYSHINTYFFLI